MVAAVSLCRYYATIICPKVSTPSYILIIPSKYVQGAGEMSRIYSYAKNYGKKALILITESGYRRIGDLVEISFQEKLLRLYLTIFMANAVKVRVTD